MNHVERIVRKLHREKNSYVEALQQKDMTTTIINSQGSIHIHETTNTGIRLRLFRGSSCVSFSTSMAEGEDLPERILDHLSFLHTSATVSPDRMLSRASHVQDDRSQVRIQSDPSTVPIEDKVDIIRYFGDVIKETSRGFNTKKFVVRYVDRLRSEFFCSSEGAYIRQLLPRTIIESGLKMLYNGRMRHIAISPLGGSGSIESMKAYSFKEMCEESLEDLRHSGPPKRIRLGWIPVMITGCAISTVIHELLVHRLEADVSDLNSTHVGHPFCSDSITLIDDPTSTKGICSYFYDEEGIRSRRKVLIDRGVLRGLLQSRKTADLWNVDPSGNVRAQNYASSPGIRASNVSVSPGNWTTEELVESMRRGLIVKLASLIPGRLAVIWGVLVTHGKITNLARSGTQLRFGFDDLRHVRRKSRDLQLVHFVCGKGGILRQSIEAPAFMFESLQVGGQAHA